MNKHFKLPLFLLLLVGMPGMKIFSQAILRSTSNFCTGWSFYKGEISGAQDPAFDDKTWRVLNLPHDWSIEGPFDEHNPATTDGGALPGGVGWYRKTFSLSELQKSKLFFIDFDGVYMNSEVWINGHYLGKRPYGYISFRYELTPYLNFGIKKNVIAVKVDNSMQPNSRWYSGSGIYRNVWLVETSKVLVDHWGTCITTPVVNDQMARVVVKTKLRNSGKAATTATLVTTIFDEALREVSKSVSQFEVKSESNFETTQEIAVSSPNTWSVDHPYLYKAISRVECDGQVCDNYETSFGIRSFEFDSERGFLLNGKPVKILGVCDHHDLGCLGTAINTRALERQLQILKNMGCNGIRTSHNPPAPELLDLCDKMGFIVMDEAFDMWKKEKNKYDYHMNWDEWHQRDLEDMVLRDRNHPSIFIWSIGNEIPEQTDTTGIAIASELTAILKNLDKTRPVTSALNQPYPNNFIIRSGALDLIGFNYHHQDFKDFFQNFPGQKFIGSETTSALATRGEYDMPSDSIRRWPSRWDLPFTNSNGTYNCSAYDNCSAPWGSTHEETWKEIKKSAYLSGMFIWTGFDYIGEPTPYRWPARSSYFGIIDLAGFPKDAYYMYQSEWTSKPVLHILPHWNWSPGQLIDVWAYYNQASEVELFLNGVSLGIRKKSGDDLHVSWKVPFQPGTLKAVSRQGSHEVMVTEVKTAGVPYAIKLEADRSVISADGKDLSFVKVTIVDREGNLVPHADNLVQFAITGKGSLAGVDNGSPISHESFKANNRKAMNGLCLAVLQSDKVAGNLQITATSEGLQPAVLTVVTQ